MRKSLKKIWDKFVKSNELRLHAEETRKNQDRSLVLFRKHTSKVGYRPFQSFVRKPLKQEELKVVLITDEIKHNQMVSKNLFRKSLKARKGNDVFSFNPYP